MKNLILILFALQTHSTIAQSVDYIVLDDTTQLAGEVRYDLKRADRVMFKDYREERFSTYSPSRVGQFRKGTEVYFKKQLDGQFFFAEMLVLGKINLFLMRDSFIIEFNGNTQEMNSDNFKDVLREIYSGRCNWEYNYENLKFNKSMLLNLVHGYNKNECYKTQKNPIGIHVYLGKLTTNFNQQASPLLVSEQSFSTTKFFGGIQKEFATYKRKSMLVSADLLVQSISSSLDSNNELKFDQTSLLLGFGPKYYIKKTYVNFGLDLVLRLKEETLVRNGQNNGTLGSSGTKIGFHIAGGYRIVDSNSITLSIEVRHARWNGSLSSFSTTGIGMYFGI